jgi:hypothetical protein
MQQYYNWLSIQIISKFVCLYTGKLVREMENINMGQYYNWLFSQTISNFVCLYTGKLVR